MGDRTVQTAWTCASNVLFRTQIQGFRVTYATSPSHPLKPAWTCTCSPGVALADCRHVREAERRRCRWNAHLDPGLDPEKVRDEVGETWLRCPLCKGMVHPIQVAV